jgi:hypothetical protein
MITLNKISAKPGIQGLRWFPVFTGTTSGLRLEFIPYLIRGRSDGFWTFYETIMNALTIFFGKNYTWSVIKPKHQDG